MDPLLKRLLDSAAYLPAPVKERLAGDLAGIYQFYHRSVGLKEKFDGPPPVDPVEYFQGKPEARQAIRELPASDWVQWAKDYRLDVNPNVRVKGRDGELEAREIPQNVIQAYQATAAELRGAKTIGDLEDIFVRSTIPVHVGAGAKNAKKASSPGAVLEAISSQVSTGVMGVIERLPGFERGKGSVDAWAGHKVSLAMATQEERADLKQRPYGTISTQAAEAAQESLGDRLDSGMQTGGYGSNPGLLTTLVFKDEQTSLDVAEVKKGVYEFTRIASGIDQASNLAGKGFGLAPFMQLPIYDQTRVTGTKTLSRAELRPLMAADLKHSRERLQQQAAYARQYDERYSPSNLEISRKIQAIQQSSAAQFPLQISKSGQQVWVNNDELAQLAFGSSGHVPMSEHLQERLSTADMAYRRRLFGGKPGYTEAELSKEQEYWQPSAVLRRSARGYANALMGGGPPAVDTYSNAPGLEELDAQNAGYRPQRERRGTEVLTWGSQGGAAWESEPSGTTWGKPAQLPPDWDTPLPSTEEALRAQASRQSEVSQAFYQGARSPAEIQQGAKALLAANASVHARVRMLAETRPHQPVPPSRPGPFPQGQLADPPGSPHYAPAPIAKAWGSAPEPLAQREDARYLEAAAGQGMVDDPNAIPFDNSAQMLYDSEQQAFKTEPVFEYVNLQRLTGQNFERPISLDQFRGLLSGAVVRGAKVGDAGDPLDNPISEQRYFPTLEMNKAYGKDRRPDVTAATTFEAGLAYREDGTLERSQTTRVDAESIAALRELQPGQIFYQKSGNRLHPMRVTQGARRFSLYDTLNDPQALEEWSQREGWSVAHARALFTQWLGDGKGRGHEFAYSLGFEPVTSAEEILAAQAMAANGAPPLLNAVQEGGPAAGEAESLTPVIIGYRRVKADVGQDNVVSDPGHEIADSLSSGYSDTDNAAQASAARSAASAAYGLNPKSDEPWAQEMAEGQQIADKGRVGGWKNRLRGFQRRYFNSIYAAGKKTAKLGSNGPTPLARARLRLSPDMAGLTHGHAPESLATLQQGATAKAQLSPLEQQTAEQVKGLIEKKLYQMPSERRAAIAKTIGDRFGGQWSVMSHNAWVNTLTTDALKMASGQQPSEMSQMILEGGELEKLAAYTAGKLGAGNPWTKSSAAAEVEPQANASLVFSPAEQEWAAKAAAEYQNLARALTGSENVQVGLYGDGESGPAADSAFALYNRETGRISLTRNFFNDTLIDERLGKLGEKMTPNEQRLRILSHELGHQLAPDAMRKYIRGVLNNAAPGSPNRRLIDDYIKRNKDRGLTNQAQLEDELSAEAYMSALTGFESPIFKSVGMNTAQAERAVDMAHESLVGKVLAFDPPEDMDNLMDQDAKAAFLNMLGDNEPGVPMPENPPPTQPRKAAPKAKAQAPGGPSNTKAGRQAIHPSDVDEVMNSDKSAAQQFAELMGDDAQASRANAHPAKTGQGPNGDTTRLYHGEKKPRRLKNGTVMERAKGRWFTPDLPDAAQYAAGYGENGEVNYVDVPTSDLEKYAGSQQPQKVRSSSDDPDSQYYLPKHLAEKRQPVKARAEAAPQPEQPSANAAQGGGAGGNGRNGPPPTIPEFDPANPDGKPDPNRWIPTPKQYAEYRAKAAKGGATPMSEGRFRQSRLQAMANYVRGNFMLSRDEIAEALKQDPTYMFDPGQAEQDATEFFNAREYYQYDLRRQADQEAQAEEQAERDRQVSRRRVPAAFAEKVGGAAKVRSFLQGMGVVTPGTRADGRLLGEAKWVNAEGKPVARASQSDGVAFFAKDGNGQQTRVTLDRHEVAQVENQFDQAANYALKGALPNNSAAALMTIKDRMDDYIKKWLDGLVKQVDNSPQSTPEDKTRVREFQTKAMHLATKMVGDAVDLLGENVDEHASGSNSWKGARAVRLRTTEDLQAAMEARPNLKKQVEEKFGSAQAAIDAPPTTFEDDGMYYRTGGAWYGSGAGGYHRGPGGARGFFGQGAGQALYAAYLAKRMLSMTVGPSLQEAEYYAGKIEEPAAQIAGEGPIMASQAGTAVRASLLRDYMSRGAYEQWGGISDAAYMAATSMPSLPRLASGIGMGLGIMGTGAMISGAAGMFGLTGAAATIAGLAQPVGLAVGGGIVLGTGVMEARNALNPEQQPWTWGNLVRNGAVQWSYEQARDRAISQKNGGGIDLGQLNLAQRQLYNLHPELSPVTEDETLAAMTPEQRAVYQANQRGETPAQASIRTLMEGIKGITGEEPAQISPGLRSLARSTGDLPALREQTLQLISQGFEDNYLGAESLARFEQVSDQLGYLPGQSGELFKTWSGFSEPERVQFEMRAGQTARYAGSLSGYFTNPVGAQRFTDQANVRTQMDLRGVNALMDAATMLGDPADMVLGYTTEMQKITVPVESGLDAKDAAASRMELVPEKKPERPAPPAGLSLFGGPPGAFDFGQSDLASTMPEPPGRIEFPDSPLATPATRIIEVPVQKPITLADKVKELKEKYGTYKSELAGQLAKSLIPMGVGGLEAIGAFGALGFESATQVQTASSWLEMAKQFGTSANPLDIAAASLKQDAWQSNVLGGVAQHISSLSKADIGTALQAVSGLGLDNQQAGLLGRMAGGDISAYSRMAQETGTYTYRFQNDYGAPLSTTELSGFMRFQSAQAGLGNPYAKAYTGSLQEQIANFFGLDQENPTDQETLKAYQGETYMIGSRHIGGSLARTWLNQDRNWSFQQRQMALSEQSQQENWDYTQEMWGFQDQQRALQYKFQMKDFARQGQRLEMQSQQAERQEALSWNRMQLNQNYAGQQEGFQLQQMQVGRSFAERGENLAWERMAQNNQFAVQGEELSWKRIELNEKYGGQVAQLGRERMQLYHENQLWGLQFAHQTDLQQRQWTQESWNYQDTTRSLQYGWNVEDINENIRYATGRQRRQLIKQRDRMNQMQGLEEGEIERGRENQQTMWQREDERYQKQEEFLLKVIDLDKQQQQIGEAQRLEAIELEKQEWQLSRERREYNLAKEQEEWTMGREKRLALQKIEDDTFNAAHEHRLALKRQDEEEFFEAQKRRLENEKFEREELARREKEFKRMWALEEERIQAERLHQANMHQIAVDTLAIQKQQAEENHRFQEEMRKLNETGQAISGWAAELIKNDPRPILDAIKTMVGNMRDLSPTTAEALTRLFKAVGGIQDASTIDQLTEALIQMR